MSNLKSKVAILVSLLATGAMLADLCTEPRSTFTLANYERLEIDMMMEDAVAILGEPDDIDLSMRDMQWATWNSPFDDHSSITGIFVLPSGKLKSIERAGDLPVRPLLIPDEIPKREKPPFVVKLIKHKQDQERRATMMLDPPAPSFGDPMIP